MNYISIQNNQTINIKDIPELSYNLFLSTNIEVVENKIERHCVNYFGYKIENNIKLICCIADDNLNCIMISSTIVNNRYVYNSFTAKNLIFEKFEREIHENFGLKYSDHPWLKPVRYPLNQFDNSKNILTYPFFNSNSEELHEVGVGPVHAGVIEPGHFRFICNGEQILHLEIQLGYQHRGIEQLFLEKKETYSTHNFSRKYCRRYSHKSYNGFCKFMGIDK